MAGTIEKTEQQVRHYRTAIKMQEEWLGELNELQAELREFEDNKRSVSPELMKTIKTISGKHALDITRSQPYAEKPTGSLFELGINCTWQGSLEAMVAFLTELQQQGGVTRLFRHALAQSAWQPATGGTGNPAGTHCDDESWDTGRFGPGILDVPALLDVPLDTASTRALVGYAELTDLPLFSSLYPAGTDPARIRADYQALFGEKRAGGVRRGPRERPPASCVVVVGHVPIGRQGRRHLPRLEGALQGLACGGEQRGNGNPADGAKR